MKSNKWIGEWMKKIDKILFGRRVIHNIVKNTTLHYWSFLSYTSLSSPHFLVISTLLFTFHSVILFQYLQSNLQHLLLLPPKKLNSRSIYLWHELSLDAHTDIVYQPSRSYIPIRLRKKEENNERTMEQM